MKYDYNNPYQALDQRLKELNNKEAPSVSDSHRDLLDPEETFLGNAKVNAALDDAKAKRSTSSRAERLERLRYAVEMEYRSYDDEDKARFHMGGRVVDALKDLDEELLPGGYAQVSREEVKSAIEELLKKRDRYPLSFEQGAYSVVTPARARQMAHAQYRPYTGSEDPQYTTIIRQLSVTVTDLWYNSKPLLSVDEVISMRERNNVDRPSNYGAAIDTLTCSALYLMAQRGL